MSQADPTGVRAIPRRTVFHDPFVMFGFLSACTKTIEFSDPGHGSWPSGRRRWSPSRRPPRRAVRRPFPLRHWGGLEPRQNTSGLNENFHNRGKRSEEQVQVLRALWAEPHVTFKGQWHTIDDAGINPLPTRSE